MKNLLQIMSLIKAGTGLLLSRELSKVDATIEKEAENFEKLLASIHDEENSAYSDLRKNLYSQQSLKEFIVISEILGKPKASAQMIQKKYKLKRCKPNGTVRFET